MGTHMHITDEHSHTCTCTLRRPFASTHVHRCPNPEACSRAHKCTCSQMRACSICTVTSIFHSTLDLSALGHIVKRLHSVNRSQVWNRPSVSHSFHRRSGLFRKAWKILGLLDGTVVPNREGSKFILSSACTYPPPLPSILEHEKRGTCWGQKR